MHKKLIVLSTLLTAFILPHIAHAAIYKHVDADGRVTYSNVKIKGGKKIYLEPADTSFGTKSNSEDSQVKPSTRSTKSSPTNFPKVDAETQKKRDDSRKQILLSELDSEKKALEAAKKALEEGKANPEVFKTANGGVRRNVVKYQEKVARLQAAVASHERNIELLQQEIGNL